MQGSADTGDNSDPQPPPGVVELREDVPLKAGAGSRGPRWCAGGPRFILACFAVLSAAITIALLTQIYYGDYEVVPHGSVSAAAAACSRAGADALKRGGRALDAVAAAALCLAVVAPHRTSIDASGSLLYWEYRSARTQSPVLAEWGGPTAGAGAGAARPPRLVAALATLHAQLGVLPWARLLQPAIDLARGGYEVSEGLAAAAAARGARSLAPRALHTAPHLADYLQTLQHNSSAELAAAWAHTPGGGVHTSEARARRAGSWRAYAGGAGAAAALAALDAALQWPSSDADLTFQRVVRELQAHAQAAGGGQWPPAAGVASGLAVVDSRDTYAALVTGLSTPFGSGPPTVDGWSYDEPSAPLDLAPAIIVDQQICGTRYVIGAESSAALAQAAVALAVSGAPGAVERPRVSVLPGGALALEASLPAPALSRRPLLNATVPYAAVNLVQQRADALLSHADSRGGGLAFRF